MSTLNKYLSKINFYEREEVERTINELKLKITVKDLIEKFNDVPTVKLKKDIWNKLKNTDFVKTEKEAKAKLTEYERDETNFDKIKKEVEDGKWFTPLIIHTKEHGYYLVAGNTRLMVAQVLGIENPSVKIVELGE